MEIIKGNKGLFFFALKKCIGHLQYVGFLKIQQVMNVSVMKRGKKI